MSVFEGQFEGFADELEEAIAEAADGEKSDGRMNSIQQKAIKQKVMSIVERRLDDDGSTGVEKRAGGRANGLVSSGDRAAAIKRAGSGGGLSEGREGVTEALAEGDVGGAVVAKADSVERIRRRVALLKGTAEPRSPQERYIANLEGEEKERAVSMIENQLPDEDGNRGMARALKDYGDERAEERRKQRDERIQDQRERLNSPDWE